MKEVLPYTEVLVESFGKTLKYTHKVLPATANMLPFIGKILQKEKNFRQKFSKEGSQ